MAIASPQRGRPLAQPQLPARGQPDAAIAGRRYTPLAQWQARAAWGAGGQQEAHVKKVVGLFAILAAIGGALMFWRKRQTDDEFLDEELE